MRFIHLSDLHLGKRVNGFSMLEDQKYILNEIMKIIDNENVESVIIAGDIYDKDVPPTEATQLFDDFLFKISKRNLQTFVISGNHDSAQRIAFGGRLFDKSGIHISPVFTGKIEPITIEDEFGKINIFMLPFIKPANVKQFYKDEEIKSYNDAIKIVIDNLDIPQMDRNILVTHQFVTGAITSDSEELSVGGTDNVDANNFEKFDYVALGHIHSPQKMIRETIRYCGTPLKYSFSEARNKNSVTIVDFYEKGNIDIKTIPLTPLRDLREIKGTYLEVTNRENYINTNTDDYIHITLTDEEDIPDVINKLRIIYKNLMKIDYDNKRTQSSNIIEKVKNIENKSPFDLFEEFYEKQNNSEMNQTQKDYIKNLIEKIWEA